MSTTKTIQLLLLSGVAAAALSAPASALEAQAFVDRVAEVYRTMGYELSFGEATLEGDTFTVDGLTVEVVGVDEEPMEIDTTLTFRGVSETEDGAYWAEELTVPDVDTVFTTEEDEAEGRVTLSDIRVEDLYFPAGDAASAIAQVQSFGAASTGPLSVFRNGEEVVRVESMEARSTFTPEQGTDELVDVDSTLAINGIWADLSTVSEEDPESGAVIEQLGLTEINGSITQHMTWSMADGHMVMDEFLFDFDDLGALDITFDITGFTPEVLDQIYAMQAQMGGEEMTEEQAQAQMMSGMALMQGVNIVSVAIRYDDASLADSLLDFFAEDAGTDRATFVDGLKQQLPLMIEGLGIPALNDLIVPPVSAFLDDPQSLEIAARPASPTSLLVLMAAAANPAGLIPALGLTVTANQ